MTPRGTGTGEQIAGVVNRKSAESLGVIEDRVVRCRRCPRLVAWREDVAATKRRMFADDEYWGRPVPSFGDPDGRVFVIGLAPAAHGANRTGRMFTGDRSGEWLFRALHRAGYASRPESVARGDGLELSDLLLTAAVRCAPPANRPTATERENCREFLVAELDLMHRLRVIVSLGGFAWDQLLRIAREAGWEVPIPRPRFGHLAEVVLPRPGGDRGPVKLLGSYHPSQQNTFTGRLTEPMFDAVWTRTREIASG